MAGNTWGEQNVVDSPEPEPQGGHWLRNLFTGKSHPGVHWEECGQQVREGIVPLSSVLLRAHLERPVLGSLVQERQGAIGEGPAEATKVMRGLERLL